jgi:hypothetical protein
MIKGAREAWLLCRKTLAAKKQKGPVATRPPGE